MACTLKVDNVDEHSALCLKRRNMCILFFDFNGDGLCRALPELQE